MARTRTPTSGGQNPIHAPVSGKTIRGRGKEGARGWGRGRITAHVKGQVLIATQGRDRTIPPDTDVIHGDLQDRVERMGQIRLHPVLLLP